MLGCCIVVVFFLSCSSSTQSVKVQFEESDIHSLGDRAYLVVTKIQQNTVPFTISIQPLTISQYQGIPEATSCGQISNFNPAEDGDFNATIQMVSVPAGAGNQMYTFEVEILQRFGIGSQKVFVVLLHITGGDSSITITRGCIIVYVPISNQYLRWTHNGEDIEATSLSFSYLESSGSQVLLRVERLIKDTTATNITVINPADTAMKDFSIADMYSIPTNASYVDIVIDIADNDIVQEDRVYTVTLVPNVPVGTPENNDTKNRRVTITILDNDVLNYEFLKPGSMITITEGDYVIVVFGLNPNVTNNQRLLQLATVRTANGTAQDGIDFHGFYCDDIIVSYDVHNIVIQTVYRAGPQTSRSFTVHLEPNRAIPIHNMTHIQGTITIIILDTSMPPLAPSITSFDFFKEDSNDLQVTWTQQVSDLHPVDNFSVIIKTCSKQPCDIDPDSTKEDEKIYVVSSDTRELLHPMDSKTGLFEVVVCAKNILGRSCSFSSNQVEPTQIGLVVGTERSTDQTFIVPVVIVCVLVTLLCCFIPFIILIVCCCYKKKYKETSYYPRKNMKEDLEVYTDSSNSLSWNMKKWSH